MIADPAPPPPAPPTRPPKVRRREARRGTQCLNCDSLTTTKFCPECGQENVAVNISLIEIFREAWEEFVRFDSKFFATLVPLITRPGLLTAEWGRGRRTKYLSPLKLYLTITAVFFLLVPYLKFNSSEPASRRPPVMNTQIERRSEGAGLPAPMRFIVHQLNRVDSLDRHTLMDQFVQHVPTALFALMPAFAAALWVLYCGRRRFYVEHLVYALHVHSFLFILLTIRLLTPISDAGLAGNLLNVGLIFWAAGYSAFALKRAYAQGWGKTFVKWLFLSYAYLVMLGMALFASVIMAVAAVPETSAAPVSQSAGK